MIGHGAESGIPEISVIVVAHDRVRYLREAVESVVRQDLDRSKFEIIVVKNYRDADLDAYLAGVGAKSLVSDQQPGPLKVVEAFAQSRGRVILILDDDDLFEPSRLRTIADAFRARPDLGFYGNQAIYIGPEGQTLDPRSVPRLGNRPSRPKEPLLLGPDRTPRDLRRLTNRQPDFNVGSSAVRRELIERSLPYLRRLKMTADTLLFFSALVSEYSILLDTASLTRYRIHDENNSLAGGGSPATRADRLLRFATAAEADYRTIREFVAASGNAPATQLMDAKVQLVQLIRACRDPSSSRRTFLGLLVGLAKFRDTYPVREGLPTVLAGVVCLLSPSAGRAAYRRQMQAG